ncbi:MAG: LacI family DNA-binding transcriptional regulator [Planctomycetota bacterium]
MPKPTSIYDVAAQVGVSPRSISRYFNHPAMLSEATRTRITEEIARTGFRPSSLAHRLSKGQFDTVAVLASAREDSLGDLHRMTLSHLGIEVARHGRDLLLIGVDHDNEDRVIAEHFRQSKLDGLILLNQVSPRICAAISEAGLRSISLNWRPTDMPNNRYVGIDYVHSAHEFATALLTRRPVKRVVYATIMDPENFCNQLRSQGVSAAAQAAGIPCTPFWVAAEPERPIWTHDTFKALLELVEPDTLVMCWSDHIAIELLGAAHRAGIAVPDRFAVAGFDGIAFGRLVHPTLTPAVQPWLHMAGQATDLLLTNSQRREIILPISIYWGGSC